MRVETAFYSVADEKLVWTGYSQTMNPKSSRVVIDDVARLVVQELEARADNSVISIQVASQ